MICVGSPTVTVVTIAQRGDQQTLLECCSFPLESERSKLVAEDRTPPSLLSLPHLLLETEIPLACALSCKPEWGGAQQSWLDQGG